MGGKDDGGGWIDNTKGGCAIPLLGAVLSAASALGGLVHLLF